MSNTRTAHGFESFANSRRKLIERGLRTALQKSQSPPALRKILSYSLLAPGKRLRPLLCLAAAEACGAPAARALPAACALEFIHTYSLVHDDLPAMDDDQLRRGRPTTHVVFGEAPAILAGDALLTEAFTILARDATAAGLTPALALKLIEELGTAAGGAGMVAGQHADLAAEGQSLQRRQIEAIHKKKTGALLRAAARMGAISANARAKALADLTAYSEALGLAFQIADDILDETGSLDAIGKNPGGDRERNKQTFATVVGIAAARRQAVQLRNQAIDCLKNFDDGADPLRLLARYVVGRAVPGPSLAAP